GAVDEAFSDVDPTALLRVLGQYQKAINDHAKEIKDAGLEDTLKALQSTLDSIGAAFPARLGITFDNGALRFALHFAKHPDPIEVPLDFGANLDAFPIPVSVQTAGKVSVDVGVNLDLGFGIKLGDFSDLSNLLFLTPDTKISASALITGQNLEAKVSFGGISAGLTKGVFILAPDASNTTVDDQIQLSFSLATPAGDVNHDGLVQFTEIADSILFQPPVGGLKAQFDIDTGIPVTGDPRLVVTVPDITDFSTLSVTLPKFDFSGIQLDLSS